MVDGKTGQLYKELTVIQPKTITLEEVIRCEPPPSNSIPNPYPNTITKCGCTLYVYSLSNNVTVFFSMICTLI